MESLNFANWRDFFSKIFEIHSSTLRTQVRVTKMGWFEVGFCSEESSTSDGPMVGNSTSLLECNSLREGIQAEGKVCNYTCRKAVAEAISSNTHLWACFSTNLFPHVMSCFRSIQSKLLFSSIPLTWTEIVCTEFRTFSVYLIWIQRKGGTMQLCTDWRIFVDQGH